MSVGHAPGEPQWTPDMRKDENQITEAEKQDAKRRIQGQVAEESPDDSGSGGDGEDGAAALRVPPASAAAAAMAS
jgi:phosphatidylserine decarboxylase